MVQYIKPFTKNIALEILFLLEFVTENEKLPSEELDKKVFSDCFKKFPFRTLSHVEYLPYIKVLVKEF